MVQTSPSAFVAQVKYAFLLVIYEKLHTITIENALELLAAALFYSFDRSVKGLEAGVYGTLQHHRSTLSSLQRLCLRNSIQKHNRPFYHPEKRQGSEISHHHLYPIHIYKQLQKARAYLEP